MVVLWVIPAQPLVRVGLEGRGLYSDQNSECIHERDGAILYLRFFLFESMIWPHNIHGCSLAIDIDPMNQFELSHSGCGVWSDREAEERGIWHCMSQD